MNVSNPMENTTATYVVKPAQIVLMVFNVFLTIFICTGNSFTILAVWLTPALRTVPNMYVVSLAVTDFLTGATIPYYSSNLYEPFQKYLDRRKYTCLFRYVLIYIFVANSMFCMVGIAFDRYLYIIYPLHYIRISTPAKASYIILSFWTLAISVAIIPLFYNTYSPETGCHTFHVLKPQFRVYLVCPLFFLCCLLAAFFYGSIISVALPHQRKLSQEQTEDGHRFTWNRGELKSLRMFIVVFGTFFVCWMPIFVMMILTYLGPVSKKAFRFFLILGLFNSGMNFLIYAYQNKQFRRAFKSLVGMSDSDSVSAISTDRTSYPATTAFGLVGN